MKKMSKNNKKNQQAVTPNQTENTKEQENPVDEPSREDNLDTETQTPDMETVSDTTSNSGENEIPDTDTAPEANNTPAEEPIKADNEKSEPDDDQILAAMLFDMTGAKGLPGSKVNVTKLVRDCWTVKKPGKPFPGFIQAKNILAKELFAKK